MVTLNIQDNIAEFKKQLNIVQRSQIPFALSQALNDTAFEVRAAGVEQAKTVFNNRKNWWSNRRTGFEVKTSNKNQGYGMRATVKVNAYFGETQEEGETKTPRGKRLAIPTKKTPKSFKRSDGVRLMKEGNDRIFIDKRGVFERINNPAYTKFVARQQSGVTPKRKRKADVEKKPPPKTRLKLLFTWTPQATVKKRFGFEKTAKMKAQARISHHFERRMNAALRKNGWRI
jgi:hypothetical protein